MNEGSITNVTEAGCKPKSDPEITRQLSELNDVIFKTLDRLGALYDKMSLLGNFTPGEASEEAPSPDPTTVVQKLDSILHRARSVDERVDYFNNFLGGLV